MVLHRARSCYLNYCSVSAEVPNYSCVTKIFLKKRKVRKKRWCNGGVDRLKSGVDRL